MTHFIGFTFPQKKTEKFLIRIYFHIGRHQSVHSADGHEGLRGHAGLHGARDPKVQRRGDVLGEGGLLLVRHAALRDHLAAASVRGPRADQGDHSR